MGGLWGHTGEGGKREGENLERTLSHSGGNVGRWALLRYQVPGTWYIPGIYSSTAYYVLLVCAAVCS